MHVSIIVLNKISFHNINNFYFDLSLDTHLTHTGTIGLEISFASATSEAFQIIEYGVFHTALVIDKDRVCTMIDNI